MQVIDIDWKDSSPKLQCFDEGRLTILSHSLSSAHSLIDIRYNVGLIVPIIFGTPTYAQVEEEYLFRQ